MYFRTVIFKVIQLAEHIPKIFPKRIFNKIAEGNHDGSFQFFFFKKFCIFKKILHGIFNGIAGLIFFAFFFFEKVPKEFQKKFSQAKEIPK